MIVLHARLPIRPEQRETFLGAIGPLVEASNAEPGVRSYECTESLSTPNLFIVIEEYDDQAALDAHLASEHFQAAGAGLPDLLSGAPELKVFEASDPTTMDL